MKPAADLAGRRFLVTGAAGGLGLATVDALLARQGSVVLSARSQARAEPALAGLRAAHPGADLSFLAMDLADLHDVDRAARRLLAGGDPLDVLINNAGMAGFRGLSPDGFEITFATNHLGPFLLTERLLPLLRAAPQGRIVNVSSAAHLRQRTLHWEWLREPIGSARKRIQQYGITKLMNVLHVRELARRLADTRVTTYAVHPGVVASDIWRKLPPVVRPLAKRFMLGVEEGAQTQVFCATDPGLAHVSGRYYEHSREVAENPLAADPVLGRRLWETSEAFIAEALGEGPWDGHAAPG